MILKVGDLAILDPQLAVLIDYQRPNTEGCSYPEDSMFLVAEFVTIVCGSRSFPGVILVCPDGRIVKSIREDFKKVLLP